LGGLGALGAALASSLASNAFQGDRTSHVQQGYPPQDSGMLGSILGALGKYHIYKYLYNLQKICLFIYFNFLSFMFSIFI
jgi:hypothetical protein